MYFVETNEIKADHLYIIKPEVAPVALESEVKIAPGETGNVTVDYKSQIKSDVEYVLHLYLRLKDSTSLAPSGYYTYTLRFLPVVR